MIAAIVGLSELEAMSVLAGPRLRAGDGLPGERRDKPACCRGCKSPTGKEVANPSWPRVLQETS